MKSIVHSIKTLFASALFASMTLCHSISYAGDLNVTLSQIEKQEGELLIALFNSSEAFSGKGKPVRVVKLPVNAKQLSVSFDQLDDGKYALKILQDLNSNGQMDTNMFGIPTEGYGFSNNVGKFGMPSYDEAAFEVSQTTDIEIYIR